jgi:hypothetical protein
MATAVMIQPLAGAPRFKGKIAGAFYLLTIATSVFAFVTRGRLVVPGDAAATASNLVAHEALFRWSCVLDLASTGCYLVVTVLFYQLFRPVDRTVSLLAAGFSLVGCAIGAIACLFHLAPLAVLSGARYLDVFTPEQLHALALVLLKLRAQAADIGIAFFGIYCLLIGYLIYRSTFLPRVLGALMAVAGIGWLMFLSPVLLHAVMPYNQATSALGETALTLWLLAAGVDVGRWRAQVDAPRTAAG